MGKLNIGFLITVAAVIAVLIVLFLAAYLLVPDPARVKDTLGVMAGGCYHLGHSPWWSFCRL